MIDIMPIEVNFETSTAISFLFLKRIVTLHKFLFPTIYIKKFKNVKY